MNMSIEKMLSHVYEIEGLMLVTRRLGEENTPDVITNKMHRKVRELAEMCGLHMTAEAPAAPEPVEKPVASEPSEVSEISEVSENSENSENSEPEQPAAPAADSLPDQDYDADETWQHDNGEEFNEVFKVNYEEPEHESSQVPVADREPDDDITVEFIEAPDEPEDEAPENSEPATQEPAPSMPVPPPFKLPEMSDEPVPEPDPAVVPEAEDEPDITVEFIEAEDEVIPEPEDMPLPPVPTEFPEVEETAAPLRVDEKLQRSLSKDIRKAFSLNDRFRFQRELFAGSSRAMDTAIENIEAMRSYGNAELYFFTQLGWDRDNEVVKDFMSIVRNHFQP